MLGYCKKSWIKHFDFWNTGEEQSFSFFIWEKVRKLSQWWKAEWSRTNCWVFVICKSEYWTMAIRSETVPVTEYGQTAAPAATATSPTTTTTAASATTPTGPLLPLQLPLLYHLHCFLFHHCCQKHCSLHCHCRYQHHNHHCHHHCHHHHHCRRFHHHHQWPVNTAPTTAAIIAITNTATITPATATTASTATATAIITTTVAANAALTTAAAIAVATTITTATTTVLEPLMTFFRSAGAGFCNIKSLSLSWFSYSCVWSLWYDKKFCDVVF